MERALARGVRLLGEILGYAATCDAYHRVRLDESGEEPARAMTEALEDAGVAPADVGYVQYHGTGTELNDRIETRATRIALGEHADRTPGQQREEPDRAPAGGLGRRRASRRPSSR